MFRMIEVVEASKFGYSEAVRTAVDKLLAAGEKIHFFQVVEQRGAIRNGEFSEFQVVLKVAVEPPATPIGRRRLLRKRIPRPR